MSDKSKMIAAFRQLRAEGVDLYTTLAECFQRPRSEVKMAVLKWAYGGEDALHVEDGWPEVLEEFKNEKDHPVR